MDDLHLTVYVDAGTGSFITKTRAVVPIPPIGTKIWIANTGIFQLEDVQQKVDGYAKTDAHVITNLYVRKIN